MIQKGYAFNLKTFDHLLNDEIVTDIFGEGKPFYFRTLFTDKRGWNIRNSIAWHAGYEYLYEQDRFNGFSSCTNTYTYLKKSGPEMPTPIQ